MVLLSWRKSRKIGSEKTERRSGTINGWNDEHGNYGLEGQRIFLLSI